MGSASKVLLRRKSRASGAALSHCSPGARHAWPKVTAPTARAPARYETQRFEEARPILRKTIPVSRRALGEGHRLTLKIRSLYAQTLYLDAGATLDDLHEATTTLEETERTARRVFGGAHPIIRAIETNLKNLRSVLRARETPSPR